MTFLALWFFATTATAQIYRCTAPDGTPVFSDERCGPDAKVVPGITSRKRPSTSSTSREPVNRSPEELEVLLKRCEEGDSRACTAWSKEGGTRQLREQEKQQETACEAGSLDDCESRYCQDGVSDECRRRVLGAAKLSGPTWYLREQQAQPDGSTRYAIRCLHERSREMKEVTLSCAAIASPRRCVATGMSDGFSRLDQAAADACQR